MLIAIFLKIFKKGIDKKSDLCYNITRWRENADKKEYGSVPERPKGADCKSVVTDFGGPNPPAPTKPKGSSVRMSLFVWWEPRSATQGGTNAALRGSSQQPPSRDRRGGLRSGSRAIARAPPGAVAAIARRTVSTRSHQKIASQSDAIFLSIAKQWYIIDAR